MGKTCIVPSCRSTSMVTPNKIFINVPRNMERRKSWFAAVGQENNVPKGNAYYCCEDHFDLPKESSNWMRFKLMEGISLKMKDDIVPHKNLFSLCTAPAPLTEVVKKHADINSSAPHKKQKIIHQTTEVVAGCSKTETPPLEDSPTLSFTKSSFSLTSMTNMSEDENLSQVQYENLLENRKNSTIAIIQNNSRFYLGLPKDVYILVHIITQNEDIIYRDVFITLKKIRLDDAYFRLSIDFGTSKSNIQRIFVRSVPKVANVLQNFIFFPPQQKIKTLLPIPFRYRYSNVRYIIDCFEIEIQKPSNPIHQSHTWSEYKKCNTIKYLVSGTPNGFINFISGGFGGRITDNNIVVASNFLEQVNNCGIMADRGFKHIGPLLAEKNCVLVRPPSVSGTPLDKNLAKEAKRIAALRICIERLIRRIREFKMVDIHSCVNTNLIYLLDYIVTIVCGLCNLQDPLTR